MDVIGVNHKSQLTLYLQWPLLVEEMHIHTTHIPNRKHAGFSIITWLRWLFECFLCHYINMFLLVFCAASKSPSFPSYTKTGLTRVRKLNLFWYVSFVRSILNYTDLISLVFVCYSSSLQSSPLQTVIKGVKVRVGIMTFLFCSVWYCSVFSTFFLHLLHFNQSGSIKSHNSILFYSVLKNRDIVYHVYLELNQRSRIKSTDLLYYIIL